MTPSLKVATLPGDGLGFRLAGVPVEEVAPAAAPARLAALLRDPAIAVLAVEEGLLRALPEAAAERARQHGRVVLLPFALPRRFGAAGEGRAYLAALIRRAVGYHIKLGEGAP